MKYAEKDMACKMSKKYLPLLVLQDFCLDRLLEQINPKYTF